MKLQFDATQEYQLEAIKDITDLFKWQPLNKGDFEMEIESLEDQLQIGSEFVVGNNLVLAEETMLKNLQSVQKSIISENLFLELAIKDGKLASFKYKKPYFTLEKAHLSYNGGRLFTRLEPESSWFESILEEALIEIKEYFSRIDTGEFEQMCKNFS